MLVVRVHTDIIIIVVTTTMSQYVKLYIKD